MASAQVALATITLGSAASSVTFGSIPATYRDLRLVCNGTNSVGASNEVRMQFNGDSGGNYSYVLMRGSGSATYSGSGSAGYNPIGWINNSNPTPIQVSIMDYSATDKHKSTLSRSDEAGGYLFAWAGRWANTAAITSINLYNESSANFTAGTTFALYGILA